jgi:hypothetical protein
MCTELFLATIYFLIIAIINVFLFKLLRNYSIEITKRQHIKQIFKMCTINNDSVFPFLYKYADQQKNRYVILKQLNNLFIKDDFLIIGNSYQYLAQLHKRNESTDNIYFQLLKTQILDEI